MADVTLSYKGSDILELSDSGSATLKTGGTYCEADIEVEYVKPSGGGGSPWELIADYTSDENATVLTAEIPSEYQNENVYRVEYTGESTADYPRYELNSLKTSYGSGSISNIKLVTYATRLGRQSDASGKSAKIAFIGDSTASNIIRSDYPVETFGISSYYSDDRLKAGFNIKVWRLVE